MKDFGIESVPEKGRVLNAVALQNAVLCAECDVVSDSPSDTCLVCGSRSLFNIAKLCRYASYLVRSTYFIFSVKVNYVDH